MISSRARTECRGQYRCRFHRTGGSGAEGCSGVAVVKPSAEHGVALVNAVCARAFVVPVGTRDVLCDYLRMRAVVFETNSVRLYGAVKLRADLKRLRTDLNMLLRAVE